MTPGEHTAREVLRGNARENADQMLLAQESRELLTSFMRTELDDALRIAVAEGLASFMNDENIEKFWKKGFEVAQKESRKRLRDAAGGLMLDGAKRLFKWGVGLLAVVAFAFYVGGWPSAKSVWAALTKG